MHTLLARFTTVLPESVLSHVERTWEAADLSSHGQFGINVQYHLGQVAALCAVIGRSLSLPPVDIKTVVCAGMVHDVLKPIQHHVLQQRPLDREAIKESDRQVSTFLYAQGWMRSVVEPAAASGMETLYLLERYPGTLNDIRKIFFYADCITAYGEYVTVEDRCEGSRLRYPSVHRHGEDWYGLSSRTFDVQEREIVKLEVSFARRMCLSRSEFHTRMTAAASRLFSGDQ